MGLIQAAKKAASGAGSGGMPWYMPDGTRKSFCRRIEVEDSKIGDKPVWKLFFEPTSVDGEPTPMDRPTVPISLDYNDPQQKDILIGILGRPMKDKNQVVFDSTGLLQWNGKMGDDQRIAGEVEVTYKVKPPRSKDGGGYWPAQYSIDDISYVGANSEKATAGLESMLEDVTPPAKEEPKAPAKGGRKA